MKITIEIGDVELFAKSLNNAIAAYGNIISAIDLGCEVPLMFDRLKTIPFENLRERYDCLIDVYKQVEQMEKDFDLSGLNMKWDYDKRGNYWCASRPYHDGVCDFIYTIFPVENGYIAEACNNAYGAERVAVRNVNSKKQCVFKSLKKLMKDIEDENIFWLYTGYCNCVGKVTKEEY